MQVVHRLCTSCVTAVHAECRACAHMVLRLAAMTFPKFSRHFLAFYSE